MPANSKYATERGWFLFFSILLIGVSLIRTCGSPINVRSGLATAPSPDYQRRFCDNRQTADYGDQNLDKITIPLHDGCYGDRIIIPKAWRSWQVQLSSNVGDYLSVWCVEEPNPRRTVPYNGDPNGITSDCPPNHIVEFSTEGKGTFTLIRTQTDPNAVAEAEKKEAEIAQKNLEATYKLTPVEPSAGDHTGFSITVDQCFRADENIHCKGIVTNITDARTMLELRGGKIVDDEGNTILLSEWYYAGDPTNSQQERGEDLLPNVPANFLFIIHDPHQNVRTINIEMNTTWYARYVESTLVFSGVPVQ
ncbi:MAG: hypothetical protein ABSE36_05920 [Terracidiphilus sp.]|jgi:hypothetical protein